ATLSCSRASESSMRDEPPSAASCSLDRPSRRTLRSMSNSRLRTKSLRRLRSIIAFSSDLANSVSRASGLGGSKSLHSVAGLATNLTTLRKKLVVSLGSAMTGYGCACANRCGGERSVAEHLLLQLAALLRFEGQCSGRPGDQAAQADGFAGFVTESVIPRFDAGQ